MNRRSLLTLLAAATLIATPAVVCAQPGVAISRGDAALAANEVMTTITSADGACSITRLAEQPGGGNTLGSWVLGAAATQVVGPYSTPQRFRMSCTKGTLTYAFAPVVLTDYALASSLSGYVPVMKAGDQTIAATGSGSDVILNAAGAIRLVTAQVAPTAADDACAAGDFIPTATFLYFCSATNTWVRVAVATWP